MSIYNTQHKTVQEQRYANLDAMFKLLQAREVKASISTLGYELHVTCPMLQEPVLMEVRTANVWKVCTDAGTAGLVVEWLQGMGIMCKADLAQGVHRSFGWEEFALIINL